MNAHGGPHGRLDFESETFIAFQQGGSNIGTTGPVSNTLTKGNGNESGGVPCIAFDTTQITSRENRNNPQPGDPCHPLAAGMHPPAIAFSGKDDLRDVSHELSPTLRCGGKEGGANWMALNQGWSVRRLTPTECERLQGFPDSHTAVPWRGGTLPDGPRYKALGNSMAVNCMRWIGRRIEVVERLYQPEDPERDPAS
ncbi:DNA cytosine methyltransferase [Methylobacterium fujisawaense]|uniref:DNA cytosine methyltransferase n=1 Tax=Methylobacterium fujisawaense TaxID=107400 RepID=UPI002F3596BE